MTAGELKQLLKVEVKEPLLRLFRRKQLYREKMPLVYVYFTEETFERRKQMLLRRVQDAESVDGLENLRGELLAHELKAAVIIFFSLLDEKQRRLYAGLESLKQGYGGCIFRSKTATIPLESCHPFRAKVATVPVESCHFWGVARNL